MTTDKQKLLPCPFCGSSNIDADGWATLLEYAETLEQRSGPACDDCGASAQTVEVWNTRAALRAPEAGEAKPVALTESERHNIEHMRHSFEHANEDSPDCCFDFDLIGGVLKTIDRLLAAAPHKS